MKSKLLTTLALATLFAACGDAGHGPTAVPSDVIREGEDIGLEEEEEVVGAPAPKPTPRPGPEPGGGVVLYDVMPDLTGCNSEPCASAWLEEIELHASIRYIYPDFIWVSSLPPPDTTAVRAECTDGKVPSTPSNFSYFAAAHGSKQCLVGNAVTEAYSASGHLVLPFTDISSTVREGLVACAAGKSCPYSDVDGQLDGLADGIVAAVNADPNAGGVAFDDERPPIPQPYSGRFYRRVAQQLDGKVLALWRGANIFTINPGAPSDDTQMLIDLRNLGAFIIASFYDIGLVPQVGQSPTEYGDRFSLFLNPGKCDGCTGSIGFLERVIATTQIPFQIGLPASASTNEWASTEAFNAPSDLFGQPPFETDPLASCGYEDEAAGPVCTVYTYQGATQDQFMEQALSRVDALASKPVDGILDTCAQSPFADGRAVACIPASAEMFCGPDVDCNKAPPSYDWSYFSETFLGMFLYAIRPETDSHVKCELRWQGGERGTCWGEYPQLIDGPASPGGEPSPVSVWDLYDRWAANRGP